MTTATLPPGLEPWGEALAALTPTLASALLPMVRALDEVFARDDALTGDEGPPDGYDGLTVHGTPERMLVSEWLLAEEAPDEFLRRAATGELLYLARSFRGPRRLGRVVALVDTGPGQLGAARLVQLAALVVLHRRAAARGGTLAVALLGTETMLEGAATTLLRAWQAGRQRSDPSAEDVRRWDARLGPGDERWLLTGPELAAELPELRRVVAVRPASWSAGGVASLHVDVGADRAELALPSREVSVRALRGLGFAAPRGAPSAVAGSMRFPSFNSNARRLLLRGEGPDQLLSVTTAVKPGQDSPRVRRYDLGAPVLAAAGLGARLVALVLDGGVLRARVVGKALPSLDGLAVPVERTGLPAAEATALAEEGLPPLYYRGGGLLCPLAGTWYELRDDDAQPLDVLAVAPGRAMDDPRVARRVGTHLTIAYTRLAGTTGEEQVVLGPDDWCAVSADGVSWRTYGLGSWQAPVVVGGDDRVLGLAVDGERPHLVTLSPGGLVVRVVGPGSVRTLTRWSGGLTAPALHPRLPLLAVQREPHRVEVGDVFSGEVLQVVRAEP